MPLATEPAASEETNVPWPRRSRTRFERERTLQDRGALSARSGAPRSAPLSTTASFTPDAARSTQSGTSPIRASAHCHSQATPGEVGLGQRRLVDGQGSPEDRPCAERAISLDDRRAQRRERADDLRPGALELGERTVGDDLPRSGPGGCCARRGEQGNRGRRTERPGDDAHAWRYRRASLERAPRNEGWKRLPGTSLASCKGLSPTCPLGSSARSGPARAYRAPQAAVAAVGPEVGPV